jgi:uncharacterized membrane protein
VLALKPIALALVLIAFAFIVIGISTPSPTTAGMESQLTRDVQVRGMTRITRHPFLWGTALWALVHFVVNGDAASAVLFGSLLLLALAGTASIDAKRRRNYGERWEQFARVTSNIPFAAIAAGRNQLGPALREIGIVRPLIAIVIFAAVFALHGRLFGASLSLPNFSLSAISIVSRFARCTLSCRSARLPRVPTYISNAAHRQRSRGEINEGKSSRTARDGILLPNDQPGDS